MSSQLVCEVPTLFQEYLKGSASIKKQTQFPKKRLTGAKPPLRGTLKGAKTTLRRHGTKHGEKEHGHTTRIQKHGRALHAVFWFISTMLLRHTGLVNKVQKYITQP